MAGASSGGIGGFSGNPDTNGAFVEFDGAGSSDSDGTVEGREWDFGDGGISALRKLSHAYSAAGSFTVTLGVGDDSALSGTDATTAAPAVSEIYSSTCAGCHGADGQGGDGPSLQVSTMSTSELQWIIANGFGGMPSFSGSLSSSEISGLASFTRGIQIPGATTSAAPTGGGDIYSSQCAGCHGAGGEGGAGPSLLTSTMSGSAISTIVADGSGGMPGYSSSLDADQISVVSAYVASLQDSDATTSPDSSSTSAAAYASQCAGCHGADGEGGFGPSLQTGTLSVTEIVSVIANGNGAMAGFSESLTPEQISGLAAFAISLQGGGSSDAGGEGSQLYAAQCAACHGVFGEGGIGPALVGTTLTTDEIGSKVQTENAAMHSLASALSPDQMEAVAAFILTLEAATDDPMDADATAKLYNTMCSGCHGAAGEGASAPALAGTSLDTADLISIIAEGRNGMPGYSTQLSSTEIEDLAGLIMAMGQGHGDVSDPDDAPTTTRAVVTAEPDPPGAGDEDGGTAAGTLGIILLSLVLGSGAYLGFASRAVRRKE
jgi:mono/diheme cytochrome c family protein